MHLRLLSTLLVAALSLTTSAQKEALSVPVSASLPVAQSFQDGHFGVSFEAPRGWNLNRRDGEVSTFRLDAPTAPPGTQMRAAVSIAYNPFPASTFAGAYFYYSVGTKMKPDACTGQASAMPPHTVSSASIAGQRFSHGYNEHGGICTESRDEIYTLPKHEACYRFDLVINTFCGGEVSGVRDMNGQQLELLRQKLESILATVHFDSK